MPVITRWGTHLQQYQKILDLRAEMITVVTDQDAAAYVPQELTHLILSSTFWENLRSLVEVLSPLATSITELESDKNINNVLKIWLRLELIFDPTVVEGIVITVISIK